MGDIAADDFASKIQSAFRPWSSD